MKAILMAAGYGGRISQFTNEPKSLLKINNKSIVRHTVEMLLENNISVTIIDGFKHELIENELKGLPVTFYYNPFFKVTNSIASLWFARNELDTTEDIIFANADVYWNQDILDLLLNDNNETVMLGDKTRALTGDYFFGCKNDKIIKYGKELLPEERTCEYVGIARIMNSYLNKFSVQMNKLIDNGEYNLWWENILYTVTDKYPVYVQDVDGKFWAEVDYIEDYERIKEEVETEIHC